MYISLCPSVPWESGTHPSPSRIPHVAMCVYPCVHPVPAYRGRVGHIPVRPVYHMYVCVSLRPSRPSVPWESGTHPSPSRIPHVCVYPYVHPVPAYRGRVGHIPVRPVYHMYVCVSLRPSRPSVPWESGTHPSPSRIPHVCVCILTSIPSQRTVGEWDTSQSVPYTTCMCVYPYVHPVPAYRGRVGHIPVRPVYHMYVCVSLRPSRPSVPWDSGTHPSLSHIIYVTGFGKTLRMGSRAIRAMRVFSSSCLNLSKSRFCHIHVQQPFF